MEKVIPALEFGVDSKQITAIKFKTSTVGHHYDSTHTYMHSWSISSFERTFSKLVPTIVYLLLFQKVQKVIRRVVWIQFSKLGMDDCVVVSNSR